MTRLLFKRRRYGYGWTPVTPGGWIIVGVFLTAIVGWSLLVLPRDKQSATMSELLVYIGGIACMIVLLYLVTRRYAPRGKWRWGHKPTDNPDEDF